MRHVVSVRKSASVVLVGLLATSLSLIGGVPASADTTDESIERLLADVDVSNVAETDSNLDLAIDLTEEVLNAPDQAEALGELSEHELEVFKAYAIPAATHEVVQVRREAATASSSLSQRVGVTATLAAVQSCWISSSTRYTTSANGNTLYSVKLQARWCGTGAVTSGSNPSLVSSTGTVYFVGWSHVGRIGSGNGVYGGAARTWVQHKFQLGAGGVVVQTMTPCRRHIGFGNGSFAPQDVCGLS